jgi:uncharacterized protein YndB with AHSA1/START domain
MAVEFSTVTSATPAALWALLVDVESWPTWTKSVTSARRIDEGPLRRGSRVRIKQPRMPGMTWQVTELTEGAEFTWAAYSIGVRTTAVHRLVPQADGTRIELEVHHSGTLGGLISRLTAARTRRYVSMEGTGLKTAAEAST